jgi:hypothetical protein
MSSSLPPGLVPNKHWPAIIDRLLDGTDAERDEARDTLWVEVQRYVQRFARLPIGPLADDPEVRSDVAVKVLYRLERNGCRHLRLWREAQRAGQRTTWWGLIGTMTRHLAIDVARGSRLQLAPRGQPFRWARVMALDPAVFDTTQREVLRRSRDFLEDASQEDLEAYLTRLQEAMCGTGDRGDRGGESIAERLGLPTKRGENGEGGGTR